MRYQLGYYSYLSVTSELVGLLSGGSISLKLGTGVFKSRKHKLVSVIVYKKSNVKVNVNIVT